MGGQWEQWNQFVCENDAKNCGKCTRERVKKVKSLCENGGDCSCKEETGKDEKDKPCSVNCVMGQWEQWNQFFCEYDAKNCGKCSRERVKKIKISCEKGGDCSCKEETGKDEKDKPCPSYRLGNPGNQMKCPKSYILVNAEAECEAAANELNLKFMRSGCYGTTGCYLNSPNVFFSNCPRNTTLQGIQAVCKEF